MDIDCIIHLLVLISLVEFYLYIQYIADVKLQLLHKLHLLHNGKVDCEETHLGHDGTRLKWLDYAKLKG